MFGTTGNTYTMPGITSTASVAAQSGPTQIVTSDVAGNLATSTAAALGLATASQINAINSQLGSLSSAINNVNIEARRGIAATAAMAYAPTPSGPGRTTFAINGSVFENIGGIGVAFQHRLAGPSIPVYVSGAYGNGGGREHVGRIGLGFEW
jgi:trimeric autotransporter adhesin